jgi:autotransporter-associated beta strand protein
LNGRLLTLLARSDATVDLAGPISGNGQIEIIVQTVDFFPAGTVKFSGTQANTFIGPVTLSSQNSQFFSTVAGSNLVLDKQSTIAVPGALNVGTNCDVKLNRPHQIADAAAVSLGAGAHFDLDGNTETIGNLSMVGSWTGSTLGRSVVDTGGATLSVQGNITANNFYSNSVPTIEGKLGLPPGNHTISVGGDQFYGLDIRAQILGDGGFTKQGTAGLLLQGSNIFNGELAIAQGLLTAAHNNALGSAAGFTMLTNNGVLILNNVSIQGESLFARGNRVFSAETAGAWMEAIGTNLWSGPIILDTNLVLTGFDGSRVNLSGPVSGPAGLHGLGGTVEISGPDGNTFSGATLVRNSLLLLNKPSGVSAFGGSLVLGDNAAAPTEARWLQNYQKVGANVTLFPNSLVNLNHHSDDFGPITFNGGAIATGSGELGVYGLVTVNASGSAATIDGRLGLPPGVHEFLVNDGSPLPDLRLNATIVGTGHLRKTGAGQLWLAASNSYTGATFVDQGTLSVLNAFALGAASAGTSVSEGATLDLNAISGTMPEPLGLRGTGVGGNGALNVFGSAALRNPFPSIFAAIDLTTNTTIRVGPGSVLTVDGFISGVGPLTKTGPGVLVFSNANANTYSGDTIITDGFFDLRKPDGVVAIPGNLVLGPAAAGSPATARLFQTGGINAGATVTANANSLLDLNSMNQTLARLNLNDGGDAQTGAGRLTLSAGGVVQVGSLSPSGSHASSSITGNIGLPANNFITFNVAPYAISPPFAIAPELDVPALISVGGFESGALEPAGFSKVAQGWMRLSANNTYKGEAFVSAGTLQVEGSQPQSSARIGAGGRLQGSGTIGHVYFLGSLGVIAPGASPGILTTSNFNAGASGNGILQVELNGTTPGAGYDQVNVRGSVTLSGTTLNGSLNFASSVNDEFILINNDGSDAVIGTFNGLSQNASLYIGGEEFTVSYTGGTGNDVVLKRIPTRPLPTLLIEPAPPSSVRLLWPTNDPDFQLQFSTNLPATNWAPAMPLPTILGTNYVVTNATRGTENSSVATTVAWYRLGENDPGAASGLPVANTTTDFAGANHLQQFGGSLYTSAVSTDASNQVASSLGVQLNGSGQYLSTTAVVSAMTNNFGLEAWVKPGPISSTYLCVAYNGDTANNGWGIVWQGGAFQGWYGNVILFGSGAVTPGTWAHVALVRDDGFSTLYVNGVPASSPTIFGPKPPTTGFALGVRPQMPAVEFFDGAIDEVRVFTFAPGQFTTNEFLLNRTAAERSVAPVRFYRLSKP